MEQCFKMNSLTQLDAENTQQRRMDKYEGGLLLMMDGNKLMLMNG